MRKKRRLAVLCCLCAIAVASAGQPVFASEPTVSGGDVVSTESVESGAVGEVVETPSPADSTVSGGDNVVESDSVDSGASGGGSAVSSESVGSVTVYSDDVAVYSAYDAYYGSISNTYVEYMRGYLSKLSPTAHYVGARVGQYDYIFAFGEELSYSGGSFSGAVTVVQWNTHNGGWFSSWYDSNFSLDCGSALVYSDLSDVYPSLASSSDFTLRQVFILFVMFVIGMTVNSMYQVRKIRRIARGMNT